MGSGNKSPVCGCDGVTYWNSATAGSQGMSIAHSGMCTPGTACGGPSNLQCAAGQACNIMLADPSDCATPSPSGQCWGMPATCPLVIGSTNSTSCDNAMVCADVCGAIQHGTPWFADGTCPL